MYNHLSRKELYELAEEADWMESVICDSFFTIPNKLKHDSGYGCFDIFFFNKETNKLSVGKGRHDALHFEYFSDVKFGRINSDIFFKSKATRYFYRGVRFKIRWGCSDVVVNAV